MVFLNTRMKSRPVRKSMRILESNKLASGNTFKDIVVIKGDPQSSHWPISRCQVP